MRALFRRILQLVTALSLLLCVAAVVIWARSYGHWRGGAHGDADEDRAGVYWPRLGRRLTVASLHGVLTLLAPPAPRAGVRPAPPPPADHPVNRNWESFDDPVRRSGLVFAPADATPESLAAGMRNGQLVWEVRRHRAPGWWDGRSYEPHFSPRGARGSPTQTMAAYYEVEAYEIYDALFDLYDSDPNSHRPFTGPQAAPALLAALEDPDRWVAAHVVLTRLFDQPRLWNGNGRVHPAVAGGGGSTANHGDGQHDAEALLAHTFNGLRVDLRLLGDDGDERERLYVDHDNPLDYDYYVVRPCRATIDPAQQAAVRDQWHRRLDQPVASIRHWHLTAALLALPAGRGLASIRRLARRRARRRRGHCPGCGYDLSGNESGVCPECGGPFAAAEGPTA
jgi:hypothetical protein